MCECVRLCIYVTCVDANRRAVKLKKNKKQTYYFIQLFSIVFFPSYYFFFVLIIYMNIFMDELKENYLIIIIISFVFSIIFLFII